MIESVITVRPFRFWCQKVLPLVYDDSLSYYELLCKVVDYINGLLTDDTNVITQVNELTTFVNDYFTNLDVQQEINNKLDAMVENGQLDDVISHYVDPYIAAQNANIEAFKTTVNTHLSTQDSDINVLKARMDTFASLPSGGLSTDADAELADIRVGADGTTYPTAGDAVRGQVSDLKTNLFNNVFPVTGRQDALTWTAAGGKTSNLYCEAGKTYIIKNITPEGVSTSIGALYIDGYVDEYSVTCPYPTLTVQFTPLHSGYLRMYNGDSGNREVVLRILGIIDSLDTIKENADLLQYSELSIQSDGNRRPTTKKSGTSFNASGNEVTSATGCLTDYIPVKEGDIVASYEPNFNGRINGCVFYDENKNKITNLVQYQPYPDGYEVPSGAHYMRVSIIEQYYDDVVLRVNPYTVCVYDAVSLRRVLDRIGNGYADRKYTVFVKNGTYDIASTFTSDEINNAEYSANGWCGLVVGNNVTLKGQSRDGVVLNCEIATTYEASKRDAISTLNLKGNCTLENLTVTSKNIRYPIHDDFSASVNSVHIIKNCSFIAGVNATGQKTNGYGLGTRSGENIIMDDCYIEPYMIYHNNTGFTSSSRVIMNNCEVKEQISVWDFACEQPCYFNLNNVKSGALVHTFNGTHDQTILIEGTGEAPKFVSCGANVLYNLGFCAKKQIHYGGQMGFIVQDHYASNDPKFNTAAPCGDGVRMLGVLLEDTAGDKIGTVQTGGYISGNKLGSTDMTGWAVGNYLKVNPSTARFAVTQNASEAVAFVAVIIDSVPYVKLLH